MGRKKRITATEITTILDPRFGFDGVRSPIPWLYAPLFSDGQPRHGLHHPRPMPAMGATPGIINRMYPNKLYGQYGNTDRSGMGYGSHGYDSRTSGRSWLPVDNKYKTRGRNGGYFGYGNENTDGLKHRCIQTSYMVSMDTQLDWVWVMDHMGMILAQVAELGLLLTINAKQGEEMVVTLAIEMRTLIDRVWVMDDMGMILAQVAELGLLSTINTKQGEEMVVTLALEMRTKMV